MTRLKTYGNLSLRKRAVSTSLRDCRHKKEMQVPAMAMTL
jgi:hypothetical protein